MSTGALHSNVARLDALRHELEHEARLSQVFVVLTMGSIWIVTLPLLAVTAGDGGPGRAGVGVPEASVSQQTEPHQRGRPSRPADGSSRRQSLSPAPAIPPGDQGAAV